MAAHRLSLPEIALHSMLLDKSTYCLEGGLFILKYLSISTGFPGEEVASEAHSQCLSISESLLVPQETSIHIGFAMTSIPTRGSGAELSSFQHDDRFGRFGASQQFESKDIAGKLLISGCTVSAEYEDSRLIQ